MEDLYAKGENDFFGVQNYYGHGIVTRFIGMHNLIKDLGKLGYVLSLKMPYYSPILGAIKPVPMDNFPEEYRLHLTSSLLFIKSAQ